MIWNESFQGLYCVEQEGGIRIFYHIKNVIPHGYMVWDGRMGIRNITKIVESAMIAVLLFVLFRAFFGIAYVSGESMEPVFQEGDILLFRKWGLPKKARS